MCVVIVPETICRDISAYCVFQIIHSRLCWILSFLLLWFFFSFGISLLLWKKKVMCKNQAMLYTLIFYLIYLCHSFARRTWRREIEEWDRRKEGWRGSFAQKTNEKVRFPIWLWLESRAGPRLCPDSTEIQHCFSWSWWSILRFGSWNLVKIHSCPKKTLSGASLRLMFSPSSRCALQLLVTFWGWQLSCKGTESRPNGGTLAAILKCSETTMYWMLFLSTPTWPIPHLGNTYIAL